MKSVRRICIYIILLSIILVSNLLSEGQSYQGKSSPFGTITDLSKKNLYTGDVSYNVTNIDGYNISLSYNSNVHPLVTKSVEFKQNSWTGLGWTLELGSIVADINGTKDLIDDKYYLITEDGSQQKLIPDGSSYKLQNFKY